MASGDTTVIKKYAKIDGTNYRLIESTTYNDAQTLTGIIVSGNEGGVDGVNYVDNMASPVGEAQGGEDVTS